MILSLFLAGCGEDVVQCENITTTITLYENRTLEPTIEDVLEMCGNTTTPVETDLKNTDYINRIILLDKRLDECYAMNITYETNCSVALDDCEDRLKDIEDLLE